MFKRWTSSLIFDVDYPSIRLFQWLLCNDLRTEPHLFNISLKLICTRPDRKRKIISNGLFRTRFGWLFYHFDLIGWILKSVPFYSNCNLIVGRENAFVVSISLHDYSSIEICLNEHCTKRSHLDDLYQDDRTQVMMSMFSSFSFSIDTKMTNYCASISYPVLESSATKTVEEIKKNV